MGARAKGGRGPDSELGVEVPEETEGVKAPLPLPARLADLAMSTSCVIFWSLGVACCSLVRIRSLVVVFNSPGEEFDSNMCS